MSSPRDKAIRGRGSNCRRALLNVAIGHTDLRLISPIEGARKSANLAGFH
jgi:hypothetical protein